MLSTLSSLLPSALTEKLEKLDLRSGDNENKQHQERQSTEDGAEEDKDGVKRKDTADDAGKKEKKKRVTTNEAGSCPNLEYKTLTFYECRASLLYDHHQQRRTIHSTFRSNLYQRTHENAQ